MNHNEYPEPKYPETYSRVQIKESEPVTSAPSAVIPMQTVLLGPENTVTVCPFCKASIKTAVQYTNTSRTHIAAALWCIACCMCCVPYGSDSAKNSDHYCPNCKKYLGTYEK